MEKRFFLLACVLLAVLILLPACGGQPLENGDLSGGGLRIITATPRATVAPTITPTPLVPELDPAELSGIEIEIWYFWGNTQEDTLAELIKRFNIANEFGIKVKGRAFPHPLDLEDAVGEAIATGQAPHVVLAEPYQYLPWVAAGEVLDLSPYLVHPAYGLDVSGFYPVMLGRDQFSGGRWAFPGLFSGQVILYNQSWAEDLGFDVLPSAPTIFLEQACGAHLANRDHTGGWMIDPSPGGAAAWLLAFAPGLQQSLDFKSARVEDAYSFLSDLSKQGCVWQPVDRYPDADFATRRGLFYAVNTSEIGYVTEAFALAGSSDEWIAIGYPNPNGQPVVSLSGRSYVVLESEIETQIASWLFIREMASEGAQVRLAQEGLFLPLDSTTAAGLQELDALPPVWQGALGLLGNSVAEPVMPAWGVIRSVLQDAQSEVLDDRFVPGTMSLFLDQLDTLIQELQ